MSKPSLSKALTLTLLFVTILTTIILGGFWVYSIYSHYHERVQEIRQDYISQQQQFIKSFVQSAERLINREINAFKAPAEANGLAEYQSLVLDQINQLQFDDSGYVFAATWDGFSLAGPAKGKSVLGAKDVNGVFVVQELIKLSKQGGGFFTYHIPASTGAKPIEKISYVIGIPEWEWYIGAGFDLRILEGAIAGLQDKSRQDRNTVLLIVSVALVSLVLVIFFSAERETARIKRNYQRFMDFFTSADPENSKIDTDSMQFKEFEEIAAAANDMVARRLHVEDALQESQARLSHHLENTPLGSMAFNRDFRITEWNKAAEGIFGFTAKEAIGRHVTETILPPDVEEEVNQIWELLLENRGGIRSTNENLTKGGRVINCDWYNTPIIGKNGEVIGVMSLVQDNTERKMLEEQVNRSQKLEAVGQLTGGVAHDFNNLMAVMMGNLELALEQLDPDAPLRQQIDNALNAVGRGATLTKQLLSFSRRQMLSPAVTDIQHLVDDTLSFLERTLGETIQIVIKHPEDPIFVNIDSDIFGNALVNLSLNARDAMPDGGTLTFCMERVDLEGEVIGLSKDPVSGPHARLTVSDTGCGMSEDVLRQVLDPFFTTKEVGKGSGLGLSMVYGFVKQSSGHMKIASEEGVGTTISIYLPISEPFEVGGGVDTNSALELGPQKSILLVEDDEQVREVTSATLKELGYEVIEAEDGAAALTILREQAEQIDLVISDVVMPKGVSGVDLAKQIAVLYPDMKILLTSGYPDKIADHEDVKELDIMLLAKPFTRSTLAAALEATAN